MNWSIDNHLPIEYLIMYLFLDNCHTALSLITDTTLAAQNVQVFETSD